MIGLSSILPTPLKHNNPNYRIENIDKKKDDLED